MEGSTRRRHHRVVGMAPCRRMEVGRVVQGTMEIALELLDLRQTSLGCNVAFS